MQGIELSIVHGSPTEVEAEAVRRAIILLAIDDATRAAAADGDSPWTTAARLEGIRGASGSTIRNAKAWRFAGRLH